MVVKAGQLLERIFSFLILFYEGIRHYYKAVKDNKGMQVENSLFFEKKMLEGAKAYRNKISYNKGGFYGLGQLVGAFREKIIDVDINESVRELLGRDHVCDLEMFKILTSIIPSYRNEAVHARDYALPKEKISSFINNTEKLFDFLGVNNSNYKDDTWVASPVHPLVVSFQESHAYRSGMEVHSYGVLSIKNNSNIEWGKIKILTPLKYLFLQVYFFL